MSKCVFCFHTLNPDVVRFVCTNFRCMQGNRQVDPVLSQYVGREMKPGWSHEVSKPADQKRWRNPPAEWICRKCSEQMAHSCPTCHHVIPSDSRTADIVTAAFTGARNSGKSVAIGSMSFFLEALIERMGSALILQEECSQSQIGDYVQRLLDGTAPPPTAAGEARSLVFSLGFVNGRARYLSLRDVAGEDLQTPSPPKANLTFLSRADLVVFLFDPLAIESIQHQLADLIPPQSGQLGVPPQTVLTHVLGHIGTGAPRLALAVSKVDALQALAVRPGHIGEIFRQAGAAVNREWPLAPEYHEQDGALLHEEVRAILQVLGGGALVNMVQNPANQRQLDHRFFALSALGGSTDANDVADHGIRPYRILDPLLWEWSERGIVQKV